MTEENGEDPMVPVVCEACGTDTEVPLPEVAGTIRRHNEQLHDGDQQAQVDPDVAERIQDLVAEDLGLV